ncbi:MAG: immunoglobulin-like domain-containing protein [Saprospiraceae bacterium]
MKKNVLFSSFLAPILFLTLGLSQLLAGGKTVYGSGSTSDSETTIDFVEEAPPVIVITLVDELGNPLANYPADGPNDNLRYRYRCGGSWVAWTSVQTDASGQITIDINCPGNNWDNKIVLSLNQTSKEQDVIVNPVFQAARVDVNLNTCDPAAPLQGGTVAQGGGYWYTHGQTDASGTKSFYAFPGGSVTVRMTYNFTSQTKSITPVTSPVTDVDFTTTTVDFFFNGTIQIASGGWQTITPPVELLPGTYNFRFDGTQVNGIVISGCAVTKAWLTVLDENGNGVEGATFRAACGGAWQSPDPPGATNANGLLFTDIPPCMTKMEAKVGNSSQELTKAQLEASDYTWVTEILRVNLINHAGNPITDQTGLLEQGGGAWISQGNFNASGFVDVQTFPTNSGRYRTTYNCNSETKDGIVVPGGPGIQELDFQTGQVVSNCGHTQYQGCGWSAFTSGMEQMPGTRTFRYPVETATVVAGEILTLTCCTPPAFSPCPSNMNVDTDPGVCTAAVTYTATATGNPAPSLSYTFAGATPGNGTGTGTGSVFNEGVTTVTITASNACPPDAVCSFTVTVSDNEAPVISLLGDNPVIHCIGAAYSDAGATASDNCDGDLTGIISVGNPVDVNTAGTYTITYDVSDAASNPALQVTRTVQVVDPQATPSAGADMFCSPGTTAITVDLNADADAYFVSASVTSGAASGFTASQTNKADGSVMEPAAAISNTGSVDAMIEYTITPYHYGQNGLNDDGGGDDCTGPAQTVTLTVKPEPVGANTTYEVCSGTTLNIDLQNLISNSVASAFEWAAAATGTVNGENSTTQYSSVIGDKLDLTIPANGNQTVVYTVTPTGTNGCAGQSFTITVVVFPCNITISDPCSCKDNATTLANGQFDETVQVNGPAGDTWTVVVAPGLYQTSSPAPPAAPLPISVGTALTESPAGVYTLSGVHVDALGYSISVTNGSVTLSISNTCYYPNPSLSGLDALYCSQDGPQTVTVTAQLGDNSGAATVENVFFELIRQSDNAVVDSQTGAGNTFSFDPGSLDSGNYTLRATFDAGDDGAGHPGCEQAIEASFEVRVVGCGAFPWGGN